MPENDKPENDKSENDKKASSSTDVESKPDIPPWLEPVSVEDEEPGLPRLWMIIGGGVIVLIFTVLVWFMYDRTVGEGNQDIPLVTAPDGPVKIPPEDQGGMEIPDQDKTVFDPIAGEPGDLPENIQDGPEDPVERPGVPVEERESISPSPADETVRDEEPTPPAPGPIRQPVPGDYLLQLGAFRTEDAAAAGWQRLSGRYPQLFTGFSPNIQRADLGERGIFYRLRAGPFDGRASADRACQRLKASGEGCIVVAQ